jgi:hypothetical protein
MRLYRGLRNPYRPELVDASRLSGTDFTDCPATALLYARSSRGVVVVLDIGTHDDEFHSRRVTKELWLDRHSQRFMMWGRFDDLITAVFPAKDLRARLRREGLRNAAHASRTDVLRAVIDDKLRVRVLRSRVGRVSSDERCSVTLPSASRCKAKRCGAPA